MASDFKDIREAIRVVVATSDLLQNVYKNDVSTFDGIPCAVIVPSDNEADYSSDSSDRVVFAFKIRLYYIIENESAMADAEVALEEVVDDLLTKLRDRDALGSACDWVEPVPSEWAYEERGEAVYRTAELNVRCVKYTA
jgi:hypothetical protein